MAERNARGGSVRPRWNTWSWDTPPPTLGRKGAAGSGCALPARTIIERLPSSTVSRAPKHPRRRPALILYVGIVYQCGFFVKIFGRVRLRRLNSGWRRWRLAGIGWVLVGPRNDTKEHEKEQERSRKRPRITTESLRTQREHPLNPPSKGDF